jgi:cytochrome b561
MHLRNGDHGYGAVTKLLHWLTVVAVAAQFAVGYTMDPGAAADRADARVDAFEERGEERAEGLPEGQGEAAEERLEAEVERREEAVDALEGSPSRAHVVLGLVILALALARLLWRRLTPLPPWAEHLGAAERTLEGWLEKVLLTLLLVVPGTGLLLLLTGEDLLPVHVAAQVALLSTVAVHAGLVLKHTVVRRHRHLGRML